MLQEKLRRQGGIVTTQITQRSKCLFKRALTQKPMPIAVVIQRWYAADKNRLRW